MGQAWGNMRRRAGNLEAGDMIAGIGAVSYFFPERIVLLLFFFERELDLAFRVVFFFFFS